MVEHDVSSSSEESSSKDMLMIWSSPGVVMGFIKGHGQNSRFLKIVPFARMFLDGLLLA